MEALSVRAERMRLERDHDERYSSLLQGFYEDLETLYSWSDGGDVAEEKNLLLARDQPVVHSGKAQSPPKLMVCHDFQGGYHDIHDARGYTFEHWQYVDTFIYFSHHRITIPPLPWIVASRRHGTDMLGTVIFEWKESASDLARLLRGPALSSLPIAGDPSFSPYFANVLIDLALKLNFSGWLINVEVPLDLGLACSGEPWPPWVGERARKRERMRNAERLRGWVAYLRSEGEARFEREGRKGQWEICWYDSVTYPDGQLQWQDALTDANAPFFAAATTLFTNYTWARPVPNVPVPGAFPPNPLSEPLELQHAVNALTRSVGSASDLGRARSDIFVGIDVFARNCYGAHDTWRSLEMVGGAFNGEFSLGMADVAPISPQSAIPSHLTPKAVEALKHCRGLSVALFAPGWTWEHNEPSTPLTSTTDLAEVNKSPRTWEQWWAEDLALWEGPHLDNATGGRPIKAYFPAHPPPLPKDLRVRYRSALNNHFDIDKDSFFWCRTFTTNFSLGSGGMRWFRNGVEEPRPVVSISNDSAFITGRDPERARKDTAIQGWTDVSATMPKPDRIWPSPVLYDLPGGHTDTQTICECALVEHDAWEGCVSLQIKLKAAKLFKDNSIGTPSTLRFLPICSVALPAVPHADASIRVGVHATIKTARSGLVQAVSVRPLQADAVAVTKTSSINGWTTVSSYFNIAGINETRLAAELGLVLGVQADGELLVGALEMDIEAEP